MAKKTKSKSVKKEIKNKGKNININIHIDQSKKTNGSNPKKSNIKTLPAYSSAPSSGGNYVRQFTQDPYYTQSQYEHMNLLKNYNNIVKPNNPMIGNGFKDNQRNDQKLLQNMNSSTINQEYKIDDETSFLNRDDSIQGRLIDFEMGDDPRTNSKPENMLLRKNAFQQLPYDDLNTRDELLEYNRETPLKIEDGTLTTPQADLKSESKSLYSRAKSPPPDEIINAMNSQDVYYKGKKIIRNNNKDLTEGKIFNTTTGLFVLPTNEQYLKSVADGTADIYYLGDAYKINKFLQLHLDKDSYGYTQNWARYMEKIPTKKPTKKTKTEEKDDSDNDPDEIFIDVNKDNGNALNAIVQSAIPPPPPVEIKIKTRSKTKEEDDNKSNTSMLSRVSSLFSPNAKEPETVEEKPVKFKPKAIVSKTVANNKKTKLTKNKVGVV